MKTKTIAILTACCFFVAALGFILYAISLDTVWVIVAIIALLAGLILRRVFPASATLADKLDSYSQADPDHDKDSSRTNKGK